jgi:hypothetical protein
MHFCFNSMTKDQQALPESGPDPWAKADTVFQIGASAVNSRLEQATTLVP